MGLTNSEAADEADDSVVVDSLGPGGRAETTVGGLLLR